MHMSFELFTHLPDMCVYCTLRVVYAYVIWLTHLPGMCVKSNYKHLEIHNFPELHIPHTHSWLSLDWSLQSQSWEGSCSRSCTHWHRHGDQHGRSWTVHPAHRGWDWGCGAWPSWFGFDFKAHQGNCSSAGKLQGSVLLHACLCLPWLVHPYILLRYNDFGAGAPLKQKDWVLENLRWRSRMRWSCDTREITDFCLSLG